MQTWLVSPLSWHQIFDSLPLCQRRIEPPTSTLATGAFQRYPTTTLGLSYHRSFHRHSCKLGLRHHYLWQHIFCFPHFWYHYHLSHHCLPYHHFWRKRGKCHSCYNCSRPKRGLFWVSGKKNNSFSSKNSFSLKFISRRLMFARSPSLLLISASSETKQRRTFSDPSFEIFAGAFLRSFEPLNAQLRIVLSPFSSLSFKNSASDNLRKQGSWGKRSSW